MENQESTTNAGSVATLDRIPVKGGDGASAQDIHFLRSSSASQGYAPGNPNMEKQPAREEGPVFRRSESEQQAVVEAEKTKDERKGVVWRFKNAFLNSDNLISTVMTLGFIKSWTDKTFGLFGQASPLDGSMSRIGLSGVADKLQTLPGRDKVNKLVYGKENIRETLVKGEKHPPDNIFATMEALGAAGGLVENLAFFMTTRGGEVPEGDNVLQRAVNSFKNPDKHSVHFGTAFITASLALMGVGQIGRSVLELKGNKPDNDTRASITRLVSGIAALTAGPMLFVGLFKIKKDDDPKKEGGKAESKPEEKQAQLDQDAKQMRDKGGKEDKPSLISSLKPSHLKGMAQYAWQNDKIGLTGRFLKLVIDAGFVLNGRSMLRSGERPFTNEAAYKTVKGGLSGMVLNTMQLHFTYDRLYRNSLKGQSGPAH